MKKHHSRGAAFIVFVVIICLCVVLDRITKAFAEAHLVDGAAQPFIPKVLDFFLVHNSGAAWGMFEGGRTVFIIVAAFTLLAMFIYVLANKKHAAFEIIALGLIAGGAIGNGIDRAMHGEVVDFIRPLFIDFPLFNVADCAITVGVALFILVSLLSLRKPKKDETATDESEEMLAEGSDDAAV